MAYIGNSPALKYASFAVQHFTTSATTGYTLDNAVTNENGIALFINNVRQQPGSSYAYTVSGTTLTLSAATTTSDTMYCVFIGKAVQTVNPPAGSVAASQLATDAVTTVKILDDAVTTAKILDTNVTGAKLNDDAISGQGALGAAPADTDEFLVSDAGVLKRVDYSYIKGITAANFRPNAKPLIINGDMAVAQRATSKTGMKASGIWVCDRWDYHESGSVPEYTMTQESLTSGDAFEDGFSKSLKFDCTTAQASLSATEYNYMRYKFEGQNLQLFKKGTANAEKYTVSFWVKATKTGTNICEFYDNTNTRHCSIAYTVSSTNTWEKKVVNFPADTTGAIVATNALGMELRFWLLAGSNYSSGTLATTWATVTAANSAVGQVNNADSTSNNWEIAGVQLEVGEYTSSTLPPFQHESYGDNLSRCQRYYEQTLSAAGQGIFSDSSGTSGSVPVVSIGFNTSKRATPTMTTTGSFTTSNTDSTFVLAGNLTSFNAYQSVSSAGSRAYWYAGAAAGFIASSEL
jgi:hypothetical protein